MTSTTIGDEKYVSLTTTKKNGDTVSSPVWIAALAGGALGFTTDSTSGKVKRIRNFPEVTLQPCNSRGVVKDGSSPVAATATVVTESDVDAVAAAINAKYGMMVKVMGAVYAVRGLFSRGPKSSRAAVRLELS